MVFVYWLHYFVFCVLVADGLTQRDLGDILWEKNCFFVCEQLYTFAPENVDLCLESASRPAMWLTCCFVTVNHSLCTRYGAHRIS